MFRIPVSLDAFYCLAGNGLSVPLVLLCLIVSLSLFFFFRGAGVCFRFCCLSVFDAWGFCLFVHESWCNASSLRERNKQIERKDDVHEQTGKEHKHEDIFYK